MDFDYAVNKLNREHGTLRTVNQSKQTAKLRVKQQQARIQKLADERRRKLAAEQRVRDKAKSVIVLSERELHLVTIPDTHTDTNSNKNKNDSLMLKPVSVWGDGDKITLPTSVLEFLMQKYNHDLSGIGQPLTFRVGVRNPSYSMEDAPICESIRKFAQRFAVGVNGDDDGAYDEEDDDEVAERTKMYLEELQHKYLAYTYAAVQEFTQDEGSVGIPSVIAQSLCRCKNKKSLSGITIDTTQTVDPAKRSESEDNVSVGDPTAMDVDNSNKTPGHIAWGAFDVPNVEVEVCCMVTLPKGKSCILKPTTQAIQKGFYDLKDVKLALEQSLTRTRASLTVGDMIHTWHRGVQFDMIIIEVEPASFGSISCINTDIEITFAPLTTTTPPQELKSNSKPDSKSLESNKVFQSTGFKLSEKTTQAHSSQDNDIDSSMSTFLKSEPPINQVENICTILLRSADKSKKRRFDVHCSSVSDLFAFASFLHPKDKRSFQLVTRFPRKVLRHSVEEKETSLFEAGLRPGQEALLIEWL